MVAVLVLGGAGVYAFQFFTPQKSASSSATSATLTTPSSSPSVGGSLYGKWVVTSGSSAGYRATEQFVGQTSPNKAIADSTAVSGSMMIVDLGGQMVAQAIKVEVDLTKLSSSDPGAVQGSFQRDRFVGPMVLETGSFRTATYQVDSISIPPTAVAGGQQTLPTSGKLTVHGTTKDVSIPMLGQINGDRIEITGSTDVNMNDYGIQTPSVGFTSVQPAVSVVFHLFFARG